MDKQQARELIKKTFEQQFEKTRYTTFVQELLNHIEYAPFNYHGNYIPDAYRQYISSLERIGKFIDRENRIDILIIRLQKDTSLASARTMQRNFVAGYLQGKYGSSNEKEAALVAYVAPDETDWRFSLVKMDYKFEQTPTGKMKAEEEFTPARRWSFLVGENEKSHTAQSRLVNILTNDEHNPTLTELEEAFNIESVTKEFFLKYRDLFICTKEALDEMVQNNSNIKVDFEAKGVNTVDFAKKLLGQIVFLYFLQKKGWFGVGRDSTWGTGSKQFLRELFEKKHGGYNNFFNDILEPLFYEALRIGEERKQDDYYYSRFNCKIPFLNGGLFDPIGNYDWIHTDMLLPDSLFSNFKKTKEEDTGDGILDIFDRYNFTVREDEPLEKEVAIDPELLGKTYEKFNAIRPDNFEEYKIALKSGKKGNESKFNKQYGVYYTPREIVHYMCQQSLINYLFTELNSDSISYEKLGDPNLEIFGNKGKKGQLDITIEHREKPLISKEDIEKFVHLGEQVSENEAIALIKEQRINTGIQKSTEKKLQLPESIRTNAELIDQKLTDITVCDPAVGSGAFPVGMMSEIVKARNALTPYLSLRGDFFGEPTKQSRTSYNFKRQCIEYSLYGVDIDPGAVEIAKLRLWLSLVVDEEDIKNIKPLPNLDYKIVCGNSLLGYPYTPRGLEKIEKLKEQFFTETNPTRKNELRSYIDDAIYSLYKNTDKSLGYKVTMDFKINFSEVFHNKGESVRCSDSEGGFDVVIANPPYEVLKGFKERPHLKKDIEIYKSAYYYSIQGNINLYKLFCEKAHILLKEGGVFCFIMPMSIICDGSSSKLRNLWLIKNRIISISIYPEKEKIFETVTQALAIVIFLKSGETSTFNVILNTAEKKQIACLSLDIIKTIDDEQYPILFLNKNELAILKKMNSSNKYFSEFIRGYEGECHQTFHKTFFKDHDTGSLLVRGINVNKWQVDLSQDNEHQRWIDKKGFLKSKGCSDTARHYLEERIIQQGIANMGQAVRLKATILQPGIFCGNSVNYFLINEEYRTIVDAKFILALLNSRLLNWRFKMTSSNNNINCYEIHKLAFPNIKDLYKEQKPFIDVIDKILSIAKSADYLTNSSKQANSKEYEKQIDKMVYQLYGLTEDEIKIVENFDKKI